MVIKEGGKDHEFEIEQFDYDIVLFYADFIVPEFIPTKFVISRYRLGKTLYGRKQ